MELFVLRAKPSSIPEQTVEHPGAVARSRVTGPGLVRGATVEQPSHGTTVEQRPFTGPGASRGAIVEQRPGMGAWAPPRHSARLTLSAPFH